MRGERRVRKRGEEKKGRKLGIRTEDERKKRGSKKDGKEDMRSRETGEIRKDGRQED